MCKLSLTITSYSFTTSLARPSAFSLGKVSSPKCCTTPSKAHNQRRLLYLLNLTPVLEKGCIAIDIIEAYKIYQLLVLALPRLYPYTYI